MFTRLRLTVQILFTALSNGYLLGFTRGEIWRGKSKVFCVPGLNCWSCPGALFSCPIGALQAVLNQRGTPFPAAPLGFLFVFGSLLGRTVCGWLCPFGLIQDLLHRIPLPWKRKRLPGHRVLKYGKYAVLLGLVLWGSLFLGTWVRVPAFCKYLCPSGTLMGALPLLSASSALREQAGGLFLWKLTVLATLVLLAAVVFRPFCQYLCPLGAFYGLLNRFSLLQLRLDETACLNCGACEHACPLALQRREISVSPECIRCGQCIQACPAGCLRYSIRNRTSPPPEPAGDRHPG